jgi:GntR family transcriptional regulator
MRPALSLVVAPTSGIPIYRQLVDQIRAQIAGGNMPADQFLPSVRQVAEELAVNPMTVSKAYSILEREGAVELVRGQGMRVRPPGPNANGKARREVLRPLLKQVARTARQLSLSGEEVAAELRSLMEEKSK